MVRLLGRSGTRSPRLGEERAQRRARRGGTPRGPGTGLRPTLSGRSVAGQVFVLQVVIVLLLVAAAVVALVLQGRIDSTQEARNRSLAVAETFANAPGTRAALDAPDPTAVLQPSAEAARKAAKVDFIVVLNTDGIRYTHPKPDRIGKKFVGTIEPALQGRSFTEEIEGTIGQLVQAVVPIETPDGRVVGLVSSGITTEHVGGAANRQLPLVFGAAGAALVLALGGTALVSKRL
ncbi:MAG: histidine kinase, partial [Streptomyces sp.]|nr:histidine kinase [Streptomyces sp.]